MPDIDSIAETRSHADALAASMGLSGSLLDYKGVTVPTGPGSTRTELVPLRQNPEAEETAPSFGGGGTADELIDHAVSARQNFEAQREGLINQLGNANRRQAHQITAQLHAIDQAEHGLDWEAEHRMRAAHDYNQQHDKELSLQRRATIDEHGAYLMSAMANLDNLFHQGQISRDEYDDGILKAMQQYPMGIENPAAARHLNYTVARQDRMADFEQRNQLRTSVRANEKLEQDLISKTGLTADEFRSIPASSVRAGKFVDAAGTEVPLGHVGGAFTNQYAEAEKGPITEIDTEQGPLHMTTAAYNRYRRIFGSNQPESVEPTGQSSLPPASGTVRVRHPNGQVGSIPASQLETALGQGYTQVTQ
jgi:hypothetical protein